MQALLPERALSWIGADEAACIMRGRFLVLEVV